MVPDHRVRDVEHAPAGHARAPRHVDVVEVEEDVGVDPADVLEHRPPQHRGPAAGPEDLGSLGARRLDRLAEEPVVRDAEDVQADAGRVDEVGPRGEAHLHRHPSDVRGEGLGEHPLQRQAVDRRVVVEQDDPLAARPRQRGVDSRREPEVRVVLDERDVGELAPQHRARSVPRVVVGDHDLGLQAGGEQRLAQREQALAQQAGRVAVDDDGADVHAHALRAARRSRPAARRAGVAARPAAAVSTRAPTSARAAAAARPSRRVQGPGR
jgi:hypothetical protein